MKMKYEHIHNRSRNNCMMGINELEGIDLDYGDDDFGDELMQRSTDNRTKSSV